MLAFYNEIDPKAAHILRQMIADGVIAPGVVDTRSIKELTANDIAGFTQVHLFAGGGLWSVAARLAGWPDDRHLWTASCPCQPFSQAGQGRGVDDPRHLWPDVARLVDECGRARRRPPVLVGEQVAGKAGYHWFDGVRSDLAQQGYGARVVDIPACAVDAPHIRQRLYWVALDMADAHGRGRDGRPEAPERSQIGRAAPKRADDVEPAARVGWREGRAEHEFRCGRAAASGADASGVTLGDAFLPRLEGQPRHGGRTGGWSVTVRPASPPDGRNGTYWSDAEWIICHDGKARRAQPGLQLLVDGIPGRVDLWRVGGNAIVPELAAEVLRALMDVLNMRDAA
jgi:DNA (cytosine-5)-methyltransferase 1